MAQVKIDNYKNLEDMLRAFKKKVNKEEILETYRDKQEYKSPSLKAKLKSEKARKRRAKSKYM